MTTLEAVATDTPACDATSRIVGVLPAIDRSLRSASRLCRSITFQTLILVHSRCQATGPGSTALDRLRARTRDRFALGAAAAERRQAAQDKTGVGDRLPADLVERFRSSRRRDEATTADPRPCATGGRAGRLLGKDVGRSAERPPSIWRRNSGRSTTPARLISKKTNPGAIISNSRLPRNPWFSLVTPANTR